MHATWFHDEKLPSGTGGGGGNQDQKYSIVATLMREEKSIGILEME
jgi:hypothetical protein